MNRGQLIKYLPELVAYYNKLAKWEDQKLAREVRNKEIQDAIVKGDKPPRKLPKLKDKPEPPVIEDVEFSHTERLSLERKTLGVYFTGHPLDEYPGLTNSAYSVEKIQSGEVEDRAKVEFPAVITSIKKKCSKKKQNYAIVMLEDCTGRMETNIFPKTWSRLSGKIQEEDIVIVSGRVSNIYQDEDKPIIKFMLNDITIPNLSNTKLDVLLYRLSGGAFIQFNPVELSDIQSWNSAKLYISSI